VIICDATSTSNIIPVKVFWDVKPCSTAVQSYVSEDLAASIFRIKDGGSKVLLKHSMASNKTST